MKDAGRAALNASANFVGTTADAGSATRELVERVHVGDARAEPQSAPHHRAFIFHYRDGIRCDPGNAPEMVIVALKPIA